MKYTLIQALFPLFIIPSIVAYNDSDISNFAKEVYKKTGIEQKFYMLPQDLFSTETHMWIDECIKLENRIAQLSQQTPTELKKRIPRTIVQDYMNQCYIPLKFARQDAFMKKIAKL